MKYYMVTFGKAGHCESCEQGTQCDSHDVVGVFDSEKALHTFCSLVIQTLDFNEIRYTTEQEKSVLKFSLEDQEYWFHAWSFEPSPTINDAVKKMFSKIGFKGETKLLPV